MAQGGNYYANLAHSLSTQDTASVANSIANALSNSSDAIDKAYQAGKNANDAFSNLLDTNGTSLGKVLDHFATKEANENIESNKQDELNQAQENVELQEAELLAKAKTDINTFVNDRTKDITGLTYDDLKDNLNSVIVSESDGNMDYSQVMWYLNNPDLIQNAQRFVNTYGLVQNAIDKDGNKIEAPVDMRVLKTLEKLNKNPNFMKYMTTIRDIEVQKDRINKGILTEDEAHRVFKQSRDNAYKVAKNYNEVEFMNTLKVQSENDLFKNWATNFNAGVPPVLWETDVIEASNKIKEEVQKSPASVTSILKETPSTPPSPEVPNEDLSTTEGMENSAIKSLTDENSKLQESLDSDRVKQYQRNITNINKSTIDGIIGETNQNLKRPSSLDVLDPSTIDNRGFVGAGSDWMGDKVNDLLYQGWEIFSLKKYSVQNGEYVDEKGKKLTDAEKEAAKEFDKKAGVTDKDTPEQAKTKREKTSKFFKDKGNKVKEFIARNKGATKLGTAGNVAKATAIKMGSPIIAAGSEIVNSVDNISTGINYALGGTNLSVSLYRPKNEPDNRLLIDAFKGKKPSDSVRETQNYMKNWDLANPNSYLPGSLEDYQMQLQVVEYLQNQGPAESVTIGGFVADNLNWLADKVGIGGMTKFKEADFQLTIIKQTLQNAIYLKQQEMESPQYKIKQNNKEIELIRTADKTTQSGINYENSQQAIKKENEAIEKGTSKLKGEERVELEKQNLENANKYSETIANEVITSVSDGQINSTGLTTPDIRTYMLNSAAGVNDVTKKALSDMSIATTPPDKTTAQVQFITNGFVADKANGSANKDAISKWTTSKNGKDNKLLKAVENSNRLITSNNWDGKFTKNGKLADAFQDLVSAYSDAMKENPLQATIELSADEQKELGNIKSSLGIIDKTTQKLFKNDKTAEALAYKTLKFQIYEVSAPLEHRDYTKPSNRDRLNKSKPFTYMQMHSPNDAKNRINTDAKNNKGTKREQYEKVVKDNVAKKPVSVIKGKNGAVTVEQVKDDKGKTAARISAKGSNAEIKEDLDWLLAEGRISQKQYDSMMPKMNRIEQLKRNQAMGLIKSLEKK